MYTTSFVTVLLASLASAAPLMEIVNSNDDQSTCQYNVPGIGSFNTLLQADFTKLTALPDTMRIDTYEVAAGHQPFARVFQEENIVFNKGESVSLLVPGPQSEGPILSAQISTTYNDILYGSVRTVAKASAVNGSVHGFFMYSNDTQETDIEILTSDSTVLHYTNQAVNGSSRPTEGASPSPADITTGFHEYRLDWTADATYYYLDGVLVSTLTENVPTEPGFWIWNNWSNGGSWSSGPPPALNDLRIKSITAYFNRTSIAGCGGATNATASATPTSTSVSSTVSSTSSSTTSSLTTPPATSTTPIVKIPVSTLSKAPVISPLPAAGANAVPGVIRISQASKPSTTKAVVKPKPTSAKTTMKTSTKAVKPTPKPTAKTTVKHQQARPAATHRP